MNNNRKNRHKNNKLLALFMAIILLFSTAMPSYADIFGIVFSYGDRTVRTSASLLGGSKVKAENLLDSLGLEGTILDVRSNNESVARAELEDGEWFIESVLDDGGAADGTCTLSITTDQGTYDIAVDIRGMAEAACISDGLEVKISSSDGRYLPEEAVAVGEIVDDSTAVMAVRELAAGTENSISLVEDSESPLFREEGVSAGDALVDEKAFEDSLVSDTLDGVEDGGFSGNDTGNEGTTLYKTFDISLSNVDMEEYDSFTVSVSLPEKLIGRDFHLYHIHDGVTTEVLDCDFLTEEERFGDVVVSGFTFSTAGFSEFVISYTVDFSYNGYEFNLEGNGEIALSQLFAILGIEENIADVVEVNDTRRTPSGPR